MAVIEYSLAEEAEIEQWLTTSSRLQSPSQTSLLDSVNSHLASRTTLLGFKPSKADIALYEALAPQVSNWTPEQKTSHPNIVRHIGFVQNSSLFGLKIGEAAAQQVTLVDWTKKANGQEKVTEAKEEEPAREFASSQPIDITERQRTVYIHALSKWRNRTGFVARYPALPTSVVTSYLDEHLRAEQRLSFKLAYDKICESEEACIQRHKCAQADNKPWSKVQYDEFLELHKALIRIYIHFLSNATMDAAILFGIPKRLWNCGVGLFLDIPRGSSSDALYNVYLLIEPLKYELHKLLASASTCQAKSCWHKILGLMYSYEMDIEESTVRKEVLAQLSKQHHKYGSSLHCGRTECRGDNPGRQLFISDIGARSCSNLNSI